MDKPTIDLSGKRALVTGGNSGIGAGVVRVLAACGAKVAINYVVHPEAAVKLAEEVDAQFGQGTALPLYADIRSEDEIAEMFKTLAQTWNGLDILVNNAGVESVQTALDLPVAEWDRVLDTNLRGAFLCAQQAARLMRESQGGVIINNQSIHDTIARLGATHYCVSKAGLDMLTRTLALEWADFGIRVVGVSPGAIHSGHPEAAKIRQKLDYEVFKNEWIPLHRFGTIEDVANLVAFLASDLASYITGTTIYVDGGYSRNLVRYDARKWFSD